MMSDEYLCERCGFSEAIAKQRYCKDCKKDVLHEMRQSGYLQRVPPQHERYRPSEAKENTYQTKHGTGH